MILLQLVDKFKVVQLLGLKNKKMFPNSKKRIVNNRLLVDEKWNNEMFMVYKLMSGFWGMVVTTRAGKFDSGRPQEFLDWDGLSIHPSAKRVATGRCWSGGGLKMGVEST